MENTFELTVSQALIILAKPNKPFKNKELYEYANKVVQHESDKIHLEYDLYLVRKRLERLM